MGSGALYETWTSGIGAWRMMASWFVGAAVGIIMIAISTPAQESNYSPFHTSNLSHWEKKAKTGTNLNVCMDGWIKETDTNARDGKMHC